MTTTSKIDLTYLNTMSDGDQGFINSMLESFLSSVPEILDNIKTRQTDEDWEELGREIHKLKPTLKYLGVNSLSEIMVTTETNCKARQNFGQINEGVEQITTITNSVLEEARSMLKS